MRRMFATLGALGAVALLTGSPTSRAAVAYRVRQVIASREVRQSVSAQCAATPLQTAPFHRRDLSLPWIVAAPTSAGISGHLFFAILPGTPFVRIGAHGTTAVLHTHGTMPGNKDAPMKILWTLENPHASDVLGPLTVTGRDLTGRGRTHQVFPRAGIAEYPSNIDIPTPGCWQLHLQIKSLAADGTTFTGVVTMIAIK